MKLFIPSVGTKIKLSTDWTFKLISERRNVKFWNSVFDANLTGYAWRDQKKDLTLPKGVVLQIDRVYVRKGPSEDYNSITFYVVNEKRSKSKFKGRFWVKLTDANNIECEIL